MSATLEQCRAWLNYANCRAFLRVIRSGESNQNDDAYTIVNGGGHFAAPPWAHPWPDGTPTTQGGKAAGAYQFLPSTWKRVAAALNLPDFSPESQDLGAVYLIAGRGAINDVLAGNLVKACALLRQEWVALDTMPFQRALAIFTEYGGKPGMQEAPETPIPAPPRPVTPQPTPAQPQPPKEARMPILALLSAFGPILAQLIPQIANILKPTEVSQRNLGLAQVAIDTITKAAGAANIQDAVEKMQASPEVVATVTQAVVTHPDILEVLEIGAGVAAAVERAIVMQTAERPFWYNPLLWISVGFFPMMYMITAAVLFFSNAGIGNDGLVVAGASWYTMVGFDQSTRSGLVNLIVGFIFGGVTAVWFGTTAQRSSSTTTTTPTTSTATTTSK